MAIKVRYKKEWFNPLFFILNDIIKKPEVQMIMVYGGKGSAKTHTISQLLLMEAYRVGASSLVFRKESTRIKKTIKKTFIKSHKGLFMQSQCMVQDFSIKVNSLKGLSSVDFTGVEDEEKIKGIEGYKYLYPDEFNQYTYEEYEQMLLSLRGQDGQILFASWNPVDENSWVKQKVVDAIKWEETEYELPNPESFVKVSDCGKYYLIKTNFKDNYWAVGSPCGTYGFKDDKLVQKYEELKIRNYSSYRVNVLGEWGKSTSGGEFFYNFKAEEHIKQDTRVNNRPTLYDPNKALYLVMDKNNLPYITGHLYQSTTIGKETHILQVDEVCVQYLPKWAEEFKKRYPSPLVHELYIGGDASAKSEDGLTEEGDNMYRKMQVLLKEYRPSLRLTNINPSVKDTAAFVNDIWLLNAQGLSFEVSSLCKKSIYDYQYALEDSKGGVVKSMITDKTTKKSYQEYGHHCDTTRYYFNTFHGREFKQWLNGGVESRGTAGRISKTQLRY